MADYLRIPASLRLAQWKREANACNPNPDWKSRAVSLIGGRIKPDGLSKGLNGSGRFRIPVYYSFTEQFRREQDAHKILNRMRHTGYFTDIHQDGLAIGIVAQLPHSRFIAGYRLTESGERVYFPDVHDTAEDAARMADEHARIIGETYMEDSEKSEEAYRTQNGIDEAKTELAKEFALRNHPRFRETSRQQCRILIMQIRDDKDTLRLHFKDYL